MKSSNFKLALISIQIINDCRIPKSNPSKFLERHFIKPIASKIIQKFPLANKCKQNKCGNLATSLVLPVVNQYAQLILTFLCGTLNVLLLHAPSACIIQIISVMSIAQTVNGNSPHRNIYTRPNMRKKTFSCKTKMACCTSWIVLSVAWNLE